MRHSSSEDSDGVGTLAWSVRTLGWLVLACALGGAVLLPILTTTDRPRFEATALVVGQQMQIKSVSLPPFAKAVFASDAMAQRVATAVAVDGSTGDAAAAGALIPDRIDLVAAEDSIVFVILGRADEPGQAARLADLGAAAFAGELNRAGSGVGAFAVESLAQVPTTESDDRGPPVSLMATAGGTAGALLGVGLVWLVIALRRPVLHRADVESRVGTRLLGTVVLFAPPAGAHPEVHRISGVAATARALLIGGYEIVVLTSPPGEELVRDRVILHVALALAPFRVLSVQAPPELCDELNRQLARRQPNGVAVGSPEPRPEMRIVDVRTLLTTMPDRRPTAVVLVIPYGVPARRACALMAQHPRSEVLGVVIVDRRGGLLRPTAHRRISRVAAPMNAVPAVAEPTPLPRVAALTGDVGRGSDHGSLW